MRATLVEIVLVSAQKRSEVLVVDEQHMIEPLSAYTGATARRARTWRVIGKVAPDPALRVVGDAPSPAATTAPRVPTKRTRSKVSAKPALTVVGSDATTAATPATEPTGSVSAWETGNAG